MALWNDLHALATRLANEGDAAWYLFHPLLRKVDTVTVAKKLGVIHPNGSRISSTRCPAHGKMHLHYDSMLGDIFCDCNGDEVFYDQVTLVAAVRECSNEAALLWLAETYAQTEEPLPL